MPDPARLGRKRGAGNDAGHHLRRRLRVAALGLSVLVAALAALAGGAARARAADYVPMRSSSVTGPARARSRRWPGSVCARALRRPRRAAASSICARARACPRRSRGCGARAGWPTPSRTTSPTSPAGRRAPAPRWGPGPNLRGRSSPTTAAAPSCRTGGSRCSGTCSPGPGSTPPRRGPICSAIIAPAARASSWPCWTPGSPIATGRRFTARPTSGAPTSSRPTTSCPTTGSRWTATATAPLSPGSSLSRPTTGSASPAWPTAPRSCPSACSTPVARATRPRSRAASATPSTTARKSST